MPIYTYRCENCGVQFDQTQKFSDPQLTKCPECGRKTLQKVYQPVGIVFKGSGFYATDHRSPSGASRAASDRKEENAEKAGKAETITEKTESKSEPKVEPAAPKESKATAAKAATE